MNKLKKLNRKGFTLIELLAVIVILAVIMVIATTSVLSSMNESRKKSLLNSASMAADSFATNYAESALVVKNDILGLPKYDGTGTNGQTDDNVKGVLSGTATIPLTDAKDALKVNDTDYDLANSFVYFNTTNSKFTVCFVARAGGNLYVGAAANTSGTEKTISSSIKKTLTGMWACSDGTSSWTTSSGDATTTSTPQSNTQ